MKRHGVTHLVDVRAIPGSSYWTDFNRARLEEIIPPTGLRYVYMGDKIGGVRNSNALCRQPGAVELPPLFEEADFKLGIRKLIEAAEVEGRRICLMCGCLRPHNCHRSKLIGPALVGLGVQVLHLDDAGEPVDQATVEEQSRDPQGALF